MGTEREEAFCTAPVQTVGAVKHVRARQVLLALGDSITVVDADSAQQHAQAQGPILALAVAPNGAFVAGFSHEGRLLVWTADFSKVLSQFETEAAGIPKALAWCGTDSVVVHLEVSGMLHAAPWLQLLTT